MDASPPASQNEKHQRLPDLPLQVQNLNLFSMYHAGCMTAGHRSSNSHGTKSYPTGRLKVKCGRLGVSAHLSGDADLSGCWLGCLRQSW